MLVSPGNGNRTEFVEVDLEDKQASSSGTRRIFGRSDRCCILRSEWKYWLSSTFLEHPFGTRTFDG